MKYLVIMRENQQVAATIPPPAILEMVEATAHMLDELHKSGKLTDTAFFADNHGGMMLFEANTSTELAETIDLLPARGFCSVECIPLMSISDWRSSFEKTKALMLEQWAKMAPK